MAVRAWRIVVCGLLLTHSVGCASFFHNLKPHRLRRLNYISPPTLDPEFTQSVPGQRQEPPVLRAQNPGE